MTPDNRSACDELLKNSFRKALSQVRGVGGGREGGVGSSHEPLAPPPSAVGPDNCGRARTCTTRLRRRDVSARQLKYHAFTKDGHEAAAFAIAFCPLIKLPVQDLVTGGVTASSSPERGRWARSESW
ncbi:hypothetical protein EVAR_47381_1 [Eumeta japonica]|uniref:Uncharacterized protein n=1 Tax=Eumeta variegata TaxID=151549 RepID=A0A4C1WWF5_EUMVA|nr:hypothetical protein EVAR_47381_1 [Eumeta japonica]